MWPSKSRVLFATANSRSPRKFRGMRSASTAKAATNCKPSSRPFAVMSFRWRCNLRISGIRAFEKNALNFHRLTVFRHRHPGIWFHGSQRFGVGQALGLLPVDADDLLDVSRQLA